MLNFGASKPRVGGGPGPPGPPPGSAPGSIHLTVLHLLHSVNDDPVADLHNKILDGCPPSHQSNFLHFHAVFDKILWPNNRLAPLLGLAPPLRNLGSATGW